jgi:hypothetical protein
MNRFYGYKQGLTAPGDPVMTTGTDVKKYIEEEILPNVNIDWDFWLPSQEKSPSQ